ncbi:7744_t:CDS:2, partial [Dentiscutata heterogama]
LFKEIPPKLAAMNIFPHASAGYNRGGSPTIPKAKMSASKQGANNPMHGRASHNAKAVYLLSKQVTLGVTLANLALSLVLWGEFDGNSGEYQFVQELSYVTEWQIKLGVDGLSLLFVILTCFIIPCSILASWTLPTPRTYHDLLQSWPLIEVVWVRLRAILSIYMAAGTTDYLLLTTGEFTSSVQYALWLGVFLALAIKSPIIPLHIWLPLAHSEAPLAGSILLAGIVLKMATYGFLRILVTLLPEASEFFTPLVYTLCLISILYSCLSTLRQSNLKSIIAYSSIGHMAIAILGLFSNTTLGIEGGLLLGFAHGLVSPALFVCVGIIYERWHTLIILTVDCQLSRGVLIFNWGL